MGLSTPILRKCKSLGEFSNLFIPNSSDYKADLIRCLTWVKTFKDISQTYNKHFQYTFTHDSPVKIAILDTGIDLNHPDFQYICSKPGKDTTMSETTSSVKGEEKQSERIKEQRNFCDDRNDADVTDIDGHGTHVAGIILRLAPRAELYIARVCQGNKSYGQGNMPNEKLKQSADAKKVRSDIVEVVSLFLFKIFNCVDI